MNRVLIVSWRIKTIKVHSPFYYIAQFRHVRFEISERAWVYVWFIDWLIDWRFFYKPSPPWAVVSGLSLGLCLIDWRFFYKPSPPWAVITALSLGLCLIDRLIDWLIEDFFTSPVHHERWLQRLAWVYVWLIDWLIDWLKIFLQAQSPWAVLGSMNITRKTLRHEVWGTLNTTTLPPYSRTTRCIYKRSTM